MRPSRKERGSPLGLDPDDFTRCLDVVSGLTVFAHEFLLKLNKELEHFAAFGSWLRHTLDELSTVINIDDKPAEDPQIDTLRVSEYISCYLKQSSLAAFFRREGFLRLSEYKKKGESVFELYAKSADKEPVPPGFMELAAYLEELCKTVFAKPQMAMRQQLRVGKPVTVAEREVGRMDVRMVVEGGAPVAYVALCDVEKKANSRECNLSAGFLGLRLPFLSFDNNGCPS
jgi:anaphase-promoting complex subunit 4